jgi:phosphatidylglycerol lysyltransferase
MSSLPSKQILSTYQPAPESVDKVKNLTGSKRAKRKVSQTYWAQEQELIARDTGVDLDDRLTQLKNHGDFSLAFSTAVQPKLMHHGGADGYYAYRKRWGFTFMLGDCVAPPSQRELIINEVVDNYKRISFCQIGHETATVLAARGFFVNEMGIDTVLDLPDYTFAGKEKEWLRYAANWTARREFRIVEAEFDVVTPEKVEEVSEAWRKTRTVKRKEVRFLNRPIVLKDEPDVRKFFLFSPENQLLAFIFLDPLYRDGKLVGYVTAFKRRHPDAPLYAEHAIMKHLIEKLKSEGVQELRLGLSPLAWIEDDEFQSNSMTSRGFKYIYNAGWVNKHFYNLTGHADYKRRFRGREEKVYFASPTKFNTPRMLALVGLCGVA